ncbi:histidine kinase [Caldithrix abyssi DSM 13497]|uniref:histidine kinase n=1 Tax=Caldithrix abyssi DSM 13497 TaxID=880073 RepID=H1XYA0_CALAY|nr:ATP-binding protein [Caldithrix abyssi]APF19258.1 His Kinase A (phospho-acceptor) domain-containing protein [Caldithrix abyssi DSM 13497]EHO43167.1 histidine kinase [Caldithrix abyssi DSM 13497]
MLKCIFAGVFKNPCFIIGGEQPELSLATGFVFSQWLIYLLLLGMFIFVGLLVLRYFNSILFYYRFIKRHLNIPNKGVMFFDAQGHLTGFNKNISDMLHMPMEKYRGRHFKIVLQTLPQLKAQLENLLLYGQEINEELTIFSNKSILKGRLIGYPVQGLRSTIGYVVEIYDLSQEILNEREDLIHRLVRKMAHDIKTPLATIKFSVETLKYIINNIEDPEVQEDLKNINHEVNRIQSITNNYSKIAQLNKLKINIIDLAELCDETLLQFHPPEQVKIVKDISDEARLITADADQLRVVFKELVENALDAVGAQGEIRISTYPASFAREKHKDAICINISDSGIGIPSAVKDKIFEPSFTTKTHGTGLGLVFVKQIVANHQGEILIDSELHKGTKFQIIIPKEIKVQQEKDISWRRNTAY